MLSSLLGRTLQILVLTLASATAAHAAAPSIDRFKHSTWTIESGAPAVSGLAQSSDGYLWIASASGLFRFDGVAFEKIPALDASTAYDPVTTVAPARGGGVWVGYRNNGVARFADGKLTDLHFPKLARQIQVTAIVEAQDGALWVTVGRPDHALWRFAHGKWEEVGEQWGHSQLGSSSLLLGRDGTLWLATHDGLMCLPTGAHRFRKFALSRSAGLGGVTKDASGRIWYLDDLGLRPANTTSGANFYPTPGVPRRPTAIFAEDGSLWGTTWTKGIFRVASPQAVGPASKMAGEAAVEYFGRLQGLSSDSAGALLLDREGNVWIGTSRGLDMFRQADIVLEKQLAVPTSFGDNLGADTRGNVYIGQEKALWRVRPGGDPERVLATDHLGALCPGRSGDVWVQLPEGIRRIPSDREKLLPTPALTAGSPVFDCGVDRSGTLWATGGQDGLFRWEGRRWANFPIDAKSPDEDPTAVEVDSHGRLVTQFRAGLFSIIDYPRRTAVNIGGPPTLRDIRTLYSGRSGVLAAGDFGLTRWRAGRVQSLLATTYPWLTGIRGIVQTSGGETWLMARAGAMRLSTTALERAFAHPGAPLPVRTFDVRDGMPDSFANSDWRSAVEGGDGRLWFATTAGTAWLDPKRISQNRIMPTVLIHSLVADAQQYRDPSALKLAAGTSAIEIDYTATSLSIPSRVQFRYRLVGVDADWVDPGARRQAFYTNLKPGSYVFEVVASNSDGLWNRRGARLSFEIAPTFWQSWWFFGLCGLGCLALLWLLYEVRMRQVSAKLRNRLEERLGERERIARELHDTLLQGMQGLILRFQSIAERVPGEQPIRGLMERALDRADEIMVEGRERVGNLRSAESKNDLRQLLFETAAAVTAEGTLSASILVEGNAREIYAVTADEIVSIVREALFNAVSHAQASSLEVSIGYRRRALEIRVADDGVGLDQSVLEAGGRSGHYGLIGMRERADRIHAEFSLRSRPGAGAEVLLSVPAAYAYATARRGWRPKKPSEHPYGD